MKSSLAEAKRRYASPSPETFTAPIQPSPAPAPAPKKATQGELF
jgi:hypothetical protein